jgi:membrane fusion protein, multidrug efflux system
MNRSAKRIALWLALIVLVAVVAASVVRAIQHRKAATALAATPTAAALVELAPTDLVTVRQAEMSRSVSVSGGLRAVRSAQVKAKVAGELRELAVREGEPVRAGQVLGRIDPVEYEARLRQAQEQAASAQAQLDIAERSLQNNRALVDQGFISRNALDTSVSNAEAARATLQQARAGVDLARKALSDTVLRAPIDGVIAARNAQPGERVAVEARIVDIVDLSRLELEAAVPAEQVVQLAPGARASLRVDGLPEPVQATLVRINPSTQAGTRAVLVYLALDTHPALRQGLFASGNIELDRARALALPASAVRHEAGRHFVLVLHDDRVEQRQVKIGRTARDPSGGEALVEITEGLSEGDRVLAGSVGLVRDGVRVRLTQVNTAPAR